MVNNVTTSTVPNHAVNFSSNNANTSPVIVPPAPLVEPSPVETPAEDNFFSDKMLEKIEKAITSSEEAKEKKWQIELNMAYVESKQAVINAYTMSAKGEALYDNENGFSASNVNGAINIDSNLVVAIPPNNLMVPKEDDFAGGTVINIQSERSMNTATMNTTAMNAYDSVQKEREGQLFSLTA